MENGKISAMNWNLIGHEWAVRLLKRHMIENTLRQAYLVTGPAGVGRRTLALRLAQALTCTAPLAPGEACGPGDTCVRGTACTGGVCAQLPDLGAPCDDLCGRGTCVDGTCASLAPGDSCAPPVVAPGDTCGEGAACENEVCVDEPTEGEPCVTACDRALYCADTGLCTPICVL